MSVSSIASSGLWAASRSLESSASNVANVNTPGFAPSHTLATEARGGGVSTTIVRDAAPESAELSGTNLSSEMVSMISAQRAFTAALTVLKTEQDMTKTLLDLRG